MKIAYVRGFTYRVCLPPSIYSWPSLYIGRPGRVAEPAPLCCSSHRSPSCKLQRVAEDASTGRTVGGTDRKAFSRVFAPAEVHRSIKRVVEEKLGAFSVSGLVVEGTLGEVGEGSGRYSYIYGVPLHDPVEGTVLELSIPRRLADRARGLKLSGVRARGDLEPNVYQGKISFRLVVREIEPAEPNAGGEEREAERRLSALLRGWSRGGRRFPQPRPGSRIRATVIHPVAGVVLDDFARQLGEA